MAELVIHFEFRQLQINDEVYEKIRLCFEKIGCHPVLCWKWNKPDKWGVIISRGEKGRYITWDERRRQFDANDNLLIYYSPHERSEMLFSVQLQFAQPDEITNIYISSRARSFLLFFDEEEEDLTLRLQFLARGLHESLKPIRTIGEDEGTDDPWFYFGEDTWKELGELERDKCTQPHLRIWAEHPEEILDWDYLRDEGIYPDPGTWQPKVPIEFDPQYNEFHLIYEDEGKKKIALLRNCPCCGGLFPASERDASFGKLTDEEIEKFREIAWRSNEMSAIKAEFGEPDITLGHVQYGESKKIYPDMREIICYTRLSELAVVIFKEYAEGIILVNYAGKWLGGVQA